MMRPSFSSFRRKFSLKKILIRLLALTCLLIIGGWIAFRVSPWPSALLIRRVFNKEGVRVNEALERHVPPGVSAMLDQSYHPNDEDAYLDVYFPSTLQQEQVLPTIIWIHGGGWISGSKDQVANYCKVLAAQGYTVVALDYSLAPAKKYPTPVRQVNIAMGYLTAHAQQLHIDPAHFILAGDSGGAHIAAQLANLLYVPSYAAELGITPSIRASQLSGVLLYCGPYSTRNINFDSDFGSFLKTVLWSYSGEKNFVTNQAFASASVIDYVTAAFPPAFISVGNGDPLAPHSYQLARKLGAAGVPVDTLFFPATHHRSLPHEYQFNLDTEEARQALERSVKFLAALDLKATPGAAHRSIANFRILSKQLY